MDVLPKPTPGTSSVEKDAEAALAVGSRRWAADETRVAYFAECVATLENIFLQRECAVLNKEDSPGVDGKSVGRTGEATREEE